MNKHNTPLQQNGEINPLQNNCMLHYSARLLIKSEFIFHDASVLNAQNLTPSVKAMLAVQHIMLLDT